MSPAWDGDRQWHIQDVDAAGGVPTLLKELSRKPGTLRLDALTASFDLVVNRTAFEGDDGVLRGSIGKSTWEGFGPPRKR